MFTLVDLTQTLDAQSLSYPGMVRTWTAVRQNVRSDLATLSRFSDFDPHGGTHLDAPLHFAPDGADAAGVPLRLYLAIVVRIAAARIEADAIPDDCEGRAVLFSTGWEDRAGTVAYYEGFPHLTRDAARRLVDRHVGLVGLDTPSADGRTDGKPSYPAHELLCGAGVPIVEGLVNLRALLPMEGEILFAAFPLKLREIEASPVRAVALVRED